MRVQTVQELAAIIRQSRLQLGMTQADLARRAGISHGTVSRIERGLGLQLDAILTILAVLRMRVTVKPKSRSRWLSPALQADPTPRRARKNPHG